MVHKQAFLLGLCAGLLAGCTTSRQTLAPTWTTRFKPFRGPTGPDVVQMDVALIERSPADRYLNDELWSVADEHVIPLECKTLLEENGFRVGQLGGLVPARLQALVTSEKSCPDPRRLQVRAGSTTPLVVGPKVAQLHYQVRKGSEPAAIEMEQAECTLCVVPSLTDDGRVKLQFTPQVRYGEAIVQPTPNAERTGFMLHEQRPAERYATLAWEVTLGPNEFLVVGGRADRPTTLGHVSFHRPEEATPVQRLLVISARRPLNAAPGDAANERLEQSLMSKSPPLALQAALSGMRAR